MHGAWPDRALFVVEHVICDDIMYIIYLTLACGMLEIKGTGGGGLLSLHKTVWDARTSCTARLRSGYHQSF